MHYTRNVTVSTYKIILCNQDKRKTLFTKHIHQGRSDADKPKFNFNDSNFFSNSMISKLRQLQNATQVFSNFQQFSNLDNFKKNVTIFRIRTPIFPRYIKMLGKDFFLLFLTKNKWTWLIQKCLDLDNYIQNKQHVCKFQFGQHLSQNTNIP